MMTSAIVRVTNEPILILRKSYIEICGGDRDAAKLLSYFEYWHNVKVAQNRKSEHLNRVAEQHGYNPEQDVSDLQYHTMDEMYDECLGDISKKGLQKARRILRELGFISEHSNPDIRFAFDKTIYYRLEVEAVNRALDDYRLSRLSDQHNRCSQNDHIEKNMDSHRMSQNDSIDRANMDHSTGQNDPLHRSKRPDQ